MKPLYARSITDEELQMLRQSLKSANGFTVRRAQMILLSAEEALKVDVIGARLGCQGQTVRDALHALHQNGVKCLEPKAKADHEDRRAFDDPARDRLRDLIRRSPHALGYDTSL